MSLLLVSMYCRQFLLSENMARFALQKPWRNARFLNASWIWTVSGFLRQFLHRHACVLPSPFRLNMQRGAAQSAQHNYACCDLRVECSEWSAIGISRGCRILMPSFTTDSHPLSSGAGIRVSDSFLSSSPHKSLKLWPLDVENRILTDSKLFWNRLHSADSCFGRQSMQSALVVSAESRPRRFLR